LFKVYAGEGKNAPVKLPVLITCFSFFDGELMPAYKGTIAGMVLHLEALMILLL